MTAGTPARGGSGSPRTAAISLRALFSASCAACVSSRMARTVVATRRNPAATSATITWYCVAAGPDQYGAKSSASRCSSASA